MNTVFNIIPFCHSYIIQQWIKRELQNRDTAGQNSELDETKKLHLNQKNQLRSEKYSLLNEELIGLLNDNDIWVNISMVN